jgi:hypothetical protein
MPEPFDTPAAVIVAFAMTSEVIDERPYSAYPVPIPEPYEVLLATISDPDIMSWSMDELLPVEAACPVPIPEPYDELAAVMTQFEIVRSPIADLPDCAPFPVPIHEPSDQLLAFTIESEIRIVPIADSPE